MGLLLWIGLSLTIHLSNLVGVIFRHDKLGQNNDPFVTKKPQNCIRISEHNNLFFLEFQRSYRRGELITIRH